MVEHQSNDGGEETGHGEGERSDNTSNGLAFGVEPQRQIGLAGDKSLMGTLKNSLFAF